jgi:hypothetical protein
LHTFAGLSRSAGDSFPLPASDSSLVIHGLVLDSKSQTPLPYTHIFVLSKHTGAISNENGQYSLDISVLELTDTLRFQYMGYKTLKLTAGQLRSSPDVLMEENIFNLSEILVFGSNPDPRDIVKKVLENKDKNYVPATMRTKVFVRERDIQDMNEFKLKYKKSSVPQLDRDMIDMVEEKFPDNFTSFTDFLGDLYFNKNKEDSITFKIDPNRTVSLKEKDMADLEQLETIFENVFASTDSDEYWKVRSGLFGGKLDMEEENDTTQIDTLDVKPEKDTLADNERWIKYFRWGLLRKQNFPKLEDKNQWEFLYKTGRYKYTLAGGTRVNGEEVYIIDFSPRKDGLYQGRMFIAMNTYALIRADYEYAPGKVGLEIQMLGIGYTESMFGGSVYFEKQDSTYALKYFSYKSASKASINRKFSLIKKRKRWLFDKTLMEVKARLNMAMTNNESVEYLVLESEQISDEEFANFEEKKKMGIILVDQFDDQLWDGYTIIEPVKQMREYKKQKVSFMEQ